MSAIAGPAEAPLSNRNFLGKLIYDAISGILVIAIPGDVSWDLRMTERWVSTGSNCNAHTRTNGMTSSMVRQPTTEAGTDRDHYQQQYYRLPMRTESQKRRTKSNGFWSWCR
jgi:hypothetical protein